MSEQMPLADELSSVYARMSQLLLSEETLGTTLRVVVSLAQETIPGTVGAGVTLVDARGRRTTAAASDPVVHRADSLQYDIDEGPCLTAWAQRTLVRIDDVTTERRFPRWCSAVQELGLRSSLSTPLLAGSTAVGAMKVYSDRPAAFDGQAEYLLVQFAAPAAVLLANVQSYQDAQQLSDQLKDALRTRDVIATAKGILMAQSGIDEDAAFGMLVSVSQRENRKLRDVAHDIVRSTVRGRR